MTWVNSANAALLTDMYELTMAASYHSHGKGTAPATFDLFVRELPPQRRFLVAAGIDDALRFLEEMRFQPDAIAYLESLALFESSFLEALGDLRFTGEVRAVPEGEVVFATEPLLSVTAPLIEAQIVETFLLNCISFQTMVASKAARVEIACEGRPFMDFSLRRDHGADAGLKAARAAFIGGASSTSNMLAGQLYGIPTSGTMAHSYVLAFDSEIDAFRAYVDDFGSRSILLIDTFDVEQGARNAAVVAAEARTRGVRIWGVRIDSGDLAVLSTSVRKILDDSGLEAVRIVVSGDLDEHRITELLRDGIPIDSFGVGTQLGTSGDAPSVGGVYKLVQDERGPKMKLSAGKTTLPGRKQVYRVSEDDRAAFDVVALEHETIQGGRPLLRRVMTDERRIDPPDALERVRQRRQEAVEALPPGLRDLSTHGDRYEVVMSPKLGELVRHMNEHGDRG